MYNVDDAIAKIDGYVISISGGGPFVGESKLIKIDEVRRTAAYASIVSSNGVPGSGPSDDDADEDEDEDQAADVEQDPVPTPAAAEDGSEAKLQSNGSPGNRRRRGRRGGRRRSRAPGSSSSSKSS